MTHNLTQYTTIETFSTTFLSVSPSARMLKLDTLWGGILASLCVAGTLGNIISLIYFVKKKKKTIHDTLYTMMCVLDTLTSLLSWPVAVVLFALRKKMFFKNPTFCGLWTVFWKGATTMALFLVMVISVSRTVSIVAPFHNIVKPLILGAIAVYAIFEFGFVSVLYGLDVVQFVFYNDMGYCSFAPKSFKQAAGRKEIWDKVFVPIASIQTFGPITIVIVSFILSVFALLTRKSASGKGRTENKIWRASVTIAYFTGIYLFCQLPLIVTKIMSHCTLWFETKDLFSLEYFIGWNYSFLFQIVFPVLNATLNPFLYFFRMPNYKTWMRTNGLTEFTSTVGKTLASLRLKNAPFLNNTQSRQSNSALSTKVLYKYDSELALPKDKLLQTDIPEM